MEQTQSLVGDFTARGGWDPEATPGEHSQVRHLVLRLRRERRHFPAKPPRWFAEVIRSSPVKAAFPAVLAGGWDCDHWNSAAVRTSAETSVRYAFGTTTTDTLSSHPPGNHQRVPPHVARELWHAVVARLESPTP